MISFLRLVIPASLVLTTSLISKGNDFLRQHEVQQINETRRCFNCNLSAMNWSDANLQGVDLRSTNFREPT
ncbi:pentapeptide repeat-containing protein [Nostoc sp.]|uniref:pentapeptide repeat-containing protein n=1 Tax=Nostoc sp. TaxID=1180 RepID=UPI003FA57F39